MRTIARPWFNYSNKVTSACVFLLSINWIDNIWRLASDQLPIKSTWRETLKMRPSNTTNAVIAFFVPLHNYKNMPSNDTWVGRLPPGFLFLASMSAHSLPVLSEWPLVPSIFIFRPCFSFSSALKVSHTIVEFIWEDLRALSAEAESVYIFIVCMGFPRTDTTNVIWSIHIPVSSTDTSRIWPIWTPHFSPLGLCRVWPISYAWFLHQTLCSGLLLENSPCFKLLSRGQTRSSSIGVNILMGQKR